MEKKKNHNCNVISLKELTQELDELITKTFFSFFAENKKKRLRRPSERARRWLLRVPRTFPPRRVAVLLELISRHLLSLCQLLSNCLTHTDVLWRGLPAYLLESLLAMFYARLPL